VFPICIRRWKDEVGVWQFTRTPPPSADIDYTPVVTNINANVIDSLERDQIDKTLGISRESALTKADKKIKKVLKKMNIRMNWQS